MISFGTVTQKLRAQFSVGEGSDILLLLLLKICAALLELRSKPTDPREIQATNRVSGMLLWCSARARSERGLIVPMWACGDESR